MSDLIYHLVPALYFKTTAESLAPGLTLVLVLVSHKRSEFVFPQSICWGKYAFLVSMH